MKKNLLISDRSLSLDQCYDFILSDECGGNAIFVGTVRNHNKGESVKHLDFDTYEAMALKVMGEVADEAIEKYDIEKIALHHRKGMVSIREKAVIIAVSSAHRDAAFQACRYAIDELKKRVPIWKKEYLENGSYWVNAHP
ncbi:MAG: molybdenum cofactor biosynthesis protein MoaE [Saprospiraceae bacterium]|nr:molybdenum cofactor biosynthesis protein MoaE [Saprospiraceae bacterium]